MKSAIVWGLLALGCGSGFSSGTESDSGPFELPDGGPTIEASASGGAVGEGGSGNGGAGAGGKPTCQELCVKSCGVNLGCLGPCDANCRAGSGGASGAGGAASGGTSSPGNGGAAVGGTSSGSGGLSDGGGIVVDPTCATWCVCPATYVPVHVQQAASGCRCRSPDDYELCEGDPP